MGDRYFTFELASMSSDNFGYIGARTTGSNAGNFAIAGPDWKGKLPDGVRSVAPSNGTQSLAKSVPYIVSPTNSVLIVGRTAVKGAEDAMTVNKIQDQYTLTPLSKWGKADVKVPEKGNVWKPYDRNTDPLADWRTINRAMTENPPMIQHAALVENFKTIGIGPGQEVTRMDEATQRGWSALPRMGVTC